jgi:aryl-alcohol dehydrogenase-like predicted oxidoreductase
MSSNRRCSANSSGGGYGKAPGYGAMRLPEPGVWGELEDPDGAKAVLRRAVELGVNLIDTAGLPKTTRSR